MSDSIPDLDDIITEVFCTNCENEATVRLTFHDEARTPVLDFCSACKDAFDWGSARANDTYDEEGVNGY